MGSASQLHQANPRAFSEPDNWSKVQSFTQKSGEPVHDYYIDLSFFFFFFLRGVELQYSALLVSAVDFPIVSKENYVLSADIDSSQVAFNSINGLNWDLSLLVKRARTQWEAMSSPDSVNLANQFPTLDESPKKRLLRFLIFYFSE